MSDRITEKTLQSQVDKLNDKLSSNDWVDLDNAECYGGYCLTNNNSSHHLTQRMSGKDLSTYLRGALDWM